MIADEIFHGDAEGELEEGEAVDEPLHQGDDDEEGEDEESGKITVLGVEQRNDREMQHLTTFDFELMLYRRLKLCLSPVDIDDFIVDDDGQPITKKRGKKFSGYTDVWVTNTVI